MAIPDELREVIEGRRTLSIVQSAGLMRRILTGELPDIQLAALLGAMAARGETAEEIAGFAVAMREVATTLPLTDEERAELVDTCGTGGDGSRTFNISTAAALVAAAGGAKVAKHGNRAVTSKCGSADVLEALGVPIALAPAAAAEALRRHHFCFLLAPSHHPGMRAVMPVRRALGVRTLFNVLGPLLNPAGARRQVMGVYSARLVGPVAEAMKLLEVHRAFVVHGEGDGAGSGQDELSLCGASALAEVRGTSVGRMSVVPEDLGLSRAPTSALEGGDAITNAAMLRGIFAGERGPQRDAVVINTAAVLVVAEKAADLRAGAVLAAQILDSGAVAALVQRLRADKT